MRKYFIVSFLFCLLVVKPGLAIAQDQNQEDKDFYTQIASLGQTGLSAILMDSIGENSLPTDKLLSWGNSKRYRIKQQTKLATKEQVLVEVDKLRQKYDVFLSDLAPELPTSRIEFRIERMQFRYETAEDCLDFTALLRGEGEWDNINMPYYHGPQGPSTAWYRTEIELSEEMLKQPSLMLHFNGSDYYTDAFINGHHIGYHEGMLDEFEFNMRKYAKVGKNIVLVKVRNDYSMLGGEGVPRRWGNKLSASNSPGWDDPFSGWSCCPTGYGIYQDVYVVAKGAPYIADVFCRPLLDSKQVELWVETELEDGNQADQFFLKYSIYGQNFETTLVENQVAPIAIEGGRVLRKFLIDIPESKFRLWSPDEPWLYQAQVTLLNSDTQEILDTRKQQFGLRSFELKADSQPKGRFYLNNEEVRLRGANTMGFLQLSVMRHDWDRLRDDILLAKLTNMNFIRTTQRIMPKEVYEYADRLGMMMQADLPLFAYINQKQYTEILKQASGIERVLRNHPSVVLMSYLNEPMAEVKPHAISRYAYEKLFEALDVVIHNENPDRAVKYIDGDYQPPSKGYPDNHCYNIWYDEHGISLKELCRGAWMPFSKGWMYGCGEFGAEGLDHESLICKSYPDEWLKKESDGSWSPKYMFGIYSGEQTYGKHWDWFETEYTISDWVEASHNHQEWGVKKVTRAFRRMPRMNSFAIHLFIDAWPNSWMKAIIDSERTPKPAWYAYREALTPLSIQVEAERSAFYSGESYPFQVWICNDTQSTPKATIRYQLELNGKVLNTGIADASIPNVNQAVDFQGFLPVLMPEVKNKSELILRAGIFNDDKECLHQEEIKVWVYPRPSILKEQVGVIGNTQRVTDLMGGIIGSFSDYNFKSNDLIIVESEPTKAEYEELKNAVAQGGKVLVLKSALNSDLIKKNLSYSIEGKQDSSWVLFRNRKHRLVEGTQKRDLFYAYSSKLEAPSRFVFQPILSSDLTPILYNKDHIVLGELKDGQGSWIISGLELEGMLDKNPVLNSLFLNAIK